MYLSPELTPIPSRGGTPQVPEYLISPLVDHETSGLVDHGLGRDVDHGTSRMADPDI